MDLLSLPLQGHTRIHELALRLVGTLTPKQVLPQHFDDGFPPVSQEAPTGPFLRLMSRIHPKVEVLVPDYGKPVQNNEQCGEKVQLPSKIPP